MKIQKGNKYHVKHSDVLRVMAKVNDKDAIRNLYDAKHIEAGFRNGEDGMQPESCDTLEGMWKAAAEAQKSFSDYSEDVLSKFQDIKPILLKRQTLKGQERAKEKLWADEMEAREDGKTPGKIVEGDDPKTGIYHCRSLRDVDGHTFCCKNIEEVSKMVDYFNGDKSIIRIKNNFANPSAVGYSDINCNIRLPNGTVAEIQLNTMANMVAKENYGHALYEVFRSVEKDPEYSKVAELMGNAQKKLYGMSNELSSRGTFPDSIKNPFGASFKPYAEVIRQDVRSALPSIEMAYNNGKIDKKTYDHFTALVKKLG